MNNCIFCKIINGEIPSNIVYEDDLVMAFLDMNQDCPGHALVVPKEHYVSINDLPIPVLNHIMGVCLKLKTLYEEKLNIDGLTLLQNNGIAQEVKHFHMHFIPKYSVKPNLSSEEILVKLKN